MIGFERVACFSFNQCFFPDFQGIAAKSIFIESKGCLS
jgi:hypothetical protein